MINLAVFSVRENRIILTSRKIKFGIKEKKI